ncbi:MAG TPA: SDR family oxidoreductase [Gemmataceae bacterium]|nr:SDR family oxidoreductase [Gemmataceae bacterium]
MVAYFARVPEECEFPLIGAWIALPDAARSNMPQKIEEPPQETPGLTTEMNRKPDHGEKSYQGFDRLRGKAALITGGDSGIGRAVAIAYAREGADVAISYLPEEEEDARETERWVRQAGRRALLLPGDITDEQHCRTMIERVVAEFGKIDILVNNAAYQMTHQEVEEFSSEEWDHTFRTNIYAMFYLSKAALPRMKEGGAIVNTASVQAYKPNGMLLAYATTKGAIVTFSKALSELAVKQGVRVNVVAPGPVWTPLIPSTMPKEKVEKFGQDSPFGRPAQPAEMAPAFVFLASAESSYVTGSVMDLTGGKMLP